MGRIFAAAALLAIAPAFAEAATIVAEHTGNADPTTTGWSAVGTFSSVTTGAVTGDLGRDAWQVDDNGTFRGSAGYYAFDLTSAQASNAETYGWKLTATLRLFDVNSSSYSPWFGYRDGSTTVQLNFGAEADGDPIAKYYGTTSGSSAAVLGSAVGTLQGAGGGYNTFELAYDPTAGVSLAINGTSVLSGIARTSLSSGKPPQVLFGAGASYSSGGANYNLVQFKTLEPSPVPVPATLPMLAGGLILGGAMLRRKKRA